MPEKKRFDWRAFDRKLIDALDIRQVYEELGITIAPNAQPGVTGWLSCFAMGGEKNPSCAINVGLNGYRGVYTDRAGRTKAMGIRRFIETFCKSRYPSWFVAQRELAKKVGLDKEMPTNLHAGRPLEDYLQICDERLDKYFDIYARKYIKGYPDAEHPNASYEGSISVEGIRLCGGMLADLCGKQVIAFPAWGVHLFESAPNSHVCVPVYSRQLYMGPNVAPAGKVSVGTPSGLMGAFGLEHIKRADIIIKPEGLTDLLTIQTLLGPDTNIAVITNSGGSTERALPREVAPLFEGKKVFILHDADDAGRCGSAIWMNELGMHTSEVGAVELDEGFDARDFVRSIM